MAPNDENYGNRKAEKDGNVEQAATASSPSNKHQKNDETSPRQVVCRFLVKNIRGITKRVNANLMVDLLVHRDSLLDLAQIAFEDGLRKLGKCNGYAGLSTHLWNLQFNGVLYKNGWRDQNPIVGDAPMADRHIDQVEPRKLDSLPKNLKVGQKGSFGGGESGSFDFVVESLSDVTEKSKPDTDYPVTVQQVNLGWSSELTCDFLTDEQKQAAAQLRSRYEDYYSGNNAWKRDRRTRQHYAAKPEHPNWSGEESELLGLLLNADVKFKQSWNAILQYGLVERPEPATSGQWYKLRKESFRRQYTGRGLSKAEMIVTAKQLCVTLLDKATNREVPTLGPKPPNRYERALLEFCDDSDYNSDTASPDTKRRKIQQMKERHENGELGPAAECLQYYK